MNSNKLSPNQLKCEELFLYLRYYEHTQLWKKSKHKSATLFEG